MATCEYTISAVQITPNPVKTGESFIISVTLEPKKYGIITSAGKFIKTALGAIISPKKVGG